MGSVALEQENKDLIQKLARILEERSILEEKVRYLESSNSTMANDLIQHYSNDKRGSVTGKVLKNKHIYQSRKADPASSDPVGSCCILGFDQELPGFDQQSPGTIGSEEPGSAFCP